MVMAAVVFVRLVVNLLKSSGRSANYWIATGLAGSIIAGAVFDTTMTITYVTNTGYIYLGLPLLWIFAAMVIATRDNPSVVGQVFQ